MVSLWAGDGRMGVLVIPHTDMISKLRGSQDLEQALCEEDVELLIVDIYLVMMNSLKLRHIEAHHGLKDFL